MLIVRRIETSMRRLVRATGGFLLSRATLPIARYHWAAAQDFICARDYQRAAYRLEAMHRWGWITVESRFALGSSYTLLHRHQEAVELLADLSGQLDNKKAAQERRLNLAVSLLHIGRGQEALQLLPEHEIAATFPDYSDDAGELRATIRESLARAAEPTDGDVDPRTHDG